MVADYQIKLPPDIRFGSGKAGELNAVLSGKKAVIVCGKHTADKKYPFIPGNAVNFVLNAGEPDLAEVDRCRTFAAQVKAEAIVGIGGGSAIDCAKAAALLAHRSEPTAEFFYQRLQPDARQMPFIALPTTAGTGAEITGNAVLSDHRNAATPVKQSLRHATMRSDVALIDPLLLQDCPQNVIAASGFDALTQSIECYISKRANFASQLLAGAGAKLLFHNLRTFYEQGSVESREAVAEGSMLTALAFAQTGLGAVHGIGHPLGSICQIPHGVVCAVLLIPVLKFNLSQSPELTDLAQQLGHSDALEFIAALRNLRQKLALPEHFRGKLKPEYYDFIIQNSRSSSMNGNPRNYSDEEIKNLLESLS